MKRCSRKKIAEFSRLSIALVAGILSFVGYVRADVDPNQLLAFKKLYVEPVQDNVDGAFRAPVDQSFHEIFDKNPRFELVSEKAQADSWVRTIVNKKSSGLDIDITLSVAATGEVYSNDHATIPPTASGRETGAAVAQLLKTALKRIPFYGTVTGRDGQQLTFDIGAAHGLRQGDIIQISRVDSIKRHPLLKSIVDVQLVAVGSAVVDEVEDVISFGRIHEEIMGESIKKYYKVTAVEARKPEVKKKPAPENGDEFMPGLEPGLVSDEQEKDRPKLGFIGLGAQLSQFSHSATRTYEGRSVTGSAFSPGFRLTGELWITKSWFADLLVGYSTMSYANEVPTTAGTTAVQQPGSNSSTRTIGLNAGYRYLPDDSIYGPQIFAKLGYFNFKWDTPVNASELLSPKTYSSLNLGVGGTLPIVNRDWGLMLNINLLLFPSMTEETFKTGVKGTETGVGFFLGGYHFFSSKIAVRAGFLFESYSTDFDDEVGAASTSQKVVGFVPSLLYYF